MSTIKSSDEHLTLNADGASKDIKFQANGVEKASISSSGVISSDGGSTHADNVKARFGTGNDLELYHNGSNSIIKNSTGITKIQADDIRIQSADDSESLAKFVKDGGAELYHNDSKKLETTATGIDVTGAITVNGAALAGGLSEADQWRLNIDQGVQAGTYTIVNNWERVDSNSFEKIGTGMTQSSGVFTFPSTGYWLIDHHLRGNQVTGATRSVFFSIQVSTDSGSSYSSATSGAICIPDAASGTDYMSGDTKHILKVTNASTFRVKFTGFSDAYFVIDGHTTQTETSTIYLKLGDI